MCTQSVNKKVIRLWMCASNFLFFSSTHLHNLQLTNLHIAQTWTKIHRRLKQSCLCCWFFHSKFTECTSMSLQWRLLLSLSFSGWKFIKKLLLWTETLETITVNWLIEQAVSWRSVCFHFDVLRLICSSQQQLRSKRSIAWNFTFSESNQFASRRLSDFKMRFQRFFCPNLAKMDQQHFSYLLSMTSRFLPF